MKFSKYQKYHFVRTVFYNFLKNLQSYFINHEQKGTNLHKSSKKTNRNDLQIT